MGLTGLMLFQKFSNNLNLTEKETLKIKTQSLPPPRVVIYSFRRHFHQKHYSMKLQSFGGILVPKLGSFDNYEMPTP